MKTIFTERAHLMCPKMSFGITVSINATYDEEKINLKKKIKIKKLLTKKIKVR